jgi:hypothetical protein
MSLLPRLKDETWYRKEGAATIETAQRIVNRKIMLS